MAIAIIGCKLPNGLKITMGDTSVVLKGNGDYHMPNEDRKFKSPTLVHGDSLTRVDKDFAEAWFKWAEEHHYQPVLSGAVYMAKNNNEASAIAKDTSDVKTGLEQMPQQNPKKLKQEFEDAEKELDGLL